MRLKLALIVMGLLAAIAVTGASAADFNHDDGPCFETPGEALLGRCPTGYVGAKYEIQIVSEEGSGCEPYDYFELVNSALPPGLSMTRDGVISGVPTSAGFTRFWLWDRDQTFAQGGPDWCQREDKSEREFSIGDRPRTRDRQRVRQAGHRRPALYRHTHSEAGYDLNPPTGTDVQATWSVESGVLPPGLALSPQGLLTGTPTTEGSWGFVIRAQNGSTIASKTYALTVRQPLSVKSPFGSARPPSSEVGIRLGKTFTATGGSGTYTWALASGALPPGVALDAARGTVGGTPQKAGTFAFGVTATDSEGRVTNARAALIVAPRLAIKTVRVRSAKLATRYQTKLATVGGVQPVQWSVVRGKLPPGVKLSPTTGTIAGTPRRSGSFRLTLAARDALGAKSQKTFVLLVTG